MLDWVLRRIEDNSNPDYEGNYAIVLVGYLLEKDIVQVVVYDEIKEISIENPLETKGYEVLISGYISNDLKRIKVVEMKDIPDEDILISKDSIIPYIWFKTNTEKVKTRNVKGYKLFGYDSDDLFVNMKLKEYSDIGQPLFLIKTIQDSQVKRSGKRKPKQKYTIEAYQLGGN